MIAVSHLRGRRLEAPDGRAVGRLIDVLFEDHTWRVRWLLVRPRGAAHALLAPSSLLGPPAGRGALQVAGALAGCPPASADPPVSRRRSGSPSAVDARAADARLQSCREVAGYAVVRSGDAKARVRDILLDARSWSVEALVIGTGPFRRGMRVDVRDVRRIDWEDGAVRLWPEAAPDRPAQPVAGAPAAAALPREA